jgi:hypothetical protein
MAATKRLLAAKSASAEYQGGNDADRLVAEAAQQRVVERGPAGEHRELALEAEVGIGTHEFHRVRPGKARHHAIDIGDLGDVGRVVRRDQRRPQLLDDLAAVFFEHPLEARQLFVAEGRVLGDGRSALVLEVLRGVVAEHVAALRRARGGAHQERIGAALGDVLGRRHADERHGALAHIVGDGEKLEGGEWADDDVDLVAVDQFLRLGLGASRIAAGVGGDEFDLAACEGVGLFLEEHGDALFHLVAALRQRPGLDRQQAYPERRTLRDRRRVGKGKRSRARGHEFTSVELERHESSRSGVCRLIRGSLAQNRETGKGSKPRQVRLI